MLICLLVTVGWTAPVAATTYHLAPDGFDGAGGRTPATAWRTFAHAIPHLRPGDTLVLRRGTYTEETTGLPVIQCGTNAAHGTASAPITVRAEHERQAHLRGSGTRTTLQLISCHDWRLEGLRLSSADQRGGSGGHALMTRDSSHLTFRRLLLHHNNRERNTHLMYLYNTDYSLVEESEFYWFHRHAIDTSYGQSNTFRRNYCHSRGHADISGGYVSGYPTTGDDCLTIYPGSHTIAENNISEANGNLLSIQATQASTQNRVLGNISIGDKYGILVKARGATTAMMPHDTTIAHFVAVGATAVGLYARSAKNTRCDNCSFLGGRNGIVTDQDPANPGDGYYSFYADNTLVAQVASYGFRILQYAAWGLDSPNAYSNGTHFDPSATDPRITNESSVDPKLGSCKVFIPASSPLKRAGKDGKDIGASVLYRYQQGTLTDRPLWHPQTGQFPCGAVVPGINDHAGRSCVDVHQRLHVQSHGCALPYGTEPPPDGGGTRLPPPTQVRLVGP